MVEEEHCDEDEDCREPRYQLGSHGGSLAVVQRASVIPENCITAYQSRS
jgi:hypothetical protein